MSISFTSNAPSTESSKTEPCLCSQMAERWSEAYAGFDSADIRADLAVHATPGCPHCGGTGIEVVSISDAPEANFSNGNAVALLQILGLSSDLCGEVSVALARRGVMRARARQDLSGFVREPVIQHGKPRKNEDGSVELRPLRMFDPGSSPEDISDRIERFAAFVEAAASRGATTISWG